MIFGETRRRVPQEEGDRVSLLACGVNLLGHIGRSERGGSVHRVHPIRVQNSLGVDAKWVSLEAEEICTVRANCRRQIRMAEKAGHGEGADIAGPKA